MAAPPPDAHWLQHWRDLRLAHARDLATGPCRAAGEPSVVACHSRPASAVPMDVEDRDHASNAPETASVASFVHQDVEPTRTDAAALGAALLGVGGPAAPTPGAPGPLSISWPELALALPPNHAVDPHARAHPPDAPPPPPPTQHVPPSPPPPPPSVPKVQLAAAPQQTLPPNRAPLAALSASNRYVDEPAGATATVARATPATPSLAHRSPSPSALRRSIAELDLSNFEHRSLRDSITGELRHALCTRMHARPPRQLQGSQ